MPLFCVPTIRKLGNETLFSLLPLGVHIERPEIAVFSCLANFSLMFYVMILGKRPIEMVLPADQELTMAEIRMHLPNDYEIKRDLRCSGYLMV